jgi:NitT/TauT family transport system ATP-binding protein
VTQPSVLEQWTERTNGSPVPVKVRLRGVSKVFAAGHGSGAARFYAVKDVSLDVHEGEFVTLVGPSGCGKTTLLNMIAGFDTPDEGEVTCDSRPVEHAGPDRLVIFQEHGLLPWLTVRQNIEFGLRASRVPAAERDARVDRYMRMVHLERFARSRPFQLSGGMRQRVAIARALVMEPAMLLMDEPFSALDHRTRDMLHVELQDIWLKTRKTIIFVTHSVEEALRLSDRVVVMASQPGRIRRVLHIELPHPRDFFDPTLLELRGRILQDLEDEMNKLASKEGDDEWLAEAASLRHRAGDHVDGVVAPGR